MKKRYNILTKTLWYLFVFVMVSAMFCERARAALMGAVDRELHAHREEERLRKMKESDKDYHQM